MRIEEILEKVKTAHSSGSFVALLDDSLDGDPSVGQMHEFIKEARRCCVGGRGAQPQKDEALSWVVQLLFTPNSPFRNLNHLVVAYQLVIRVLEPRRMNQQEFGLCGPSHFALLLAKTRPVTYARVACDLFRSGKADVDGWTVEAPKSVMEFDPGTSIPQADWLVAASVRNSERQVPQNANDRATYENTLPHELFPWLVDAGFRRIAGFLCSQPSYSLIDSGLSALGAFQMEYFHPDRNLDLDDLPGDLRNPVANLRYACRLSAAGWKILMVVNEGLVRHTGDNYTTNVSPEMEQMNPGLGERGRLRLQQQGEQSLIATLNDNGFLGVKALVPKANHWIFVRKMHIDAEDRVVLTRYTWGTKKTTLPFPIVEFTKGYSGFFAVSL